jgi:hypothetical protein
VRLNGVASDRTRWPRNLAGARLHNRALGGDPGDEVAKPTKASAAGIKAERPGIRKLKLAQFEVVDGTATLLDLLFGATDGR